MDTEVAGAGFVSGSLGVIMAVDRTLYLVTHPESRHHVEGRVGGWFDSSLTERGRSQARAIAAELRRRIPAASAEVRSRLARAASRS
ncbi:phosphoglycerate mutase family protein [Brevibacterium oceani]|uniref:phosphoglycerate mutase family protein n=1 Tax=Brevibacterium oceani TaxID=358099 RepID=UPI001FEBE059|nr:histidine phosphatase family protein [Brevibacterium oceani]